MAYIVYLDGVALPVTPSKIQMKIKNQNKTINLINDGEVNILKSPGLTDITFTAIIPHVKYPFGYYPSGFKDASYYLDKIKQLKVDKLPFRFICSRSLPDGKLLFGTNLKVSIEDYSFNEDASDGQSLNVSIKLKQYKDYSTKLQYFESIDNTVNVKAKADALLKLYNNKKRSLTITNVFGDVRVRAGSSIPIMLNLGDIDVMNYMIVEKVMHTFSKDNHVMNLTLRGGVINA